MKVVVDGVKIELTKAQINHINKVKEDRLKGLKSFEDVLLRFGFKRFETNVSTDRCYRQDDRGWFADIIESDYVWMIGQGLKETKSFPGGWMYDTPEQLARELSKFDLT